MQTPCLRLLEEIAEGPEISAADFLAGPHALLHDVGGEIYAQPEIAAESGNGRSLF